MFLSMGLFFYDYVGFIRSTPAWETRGMKMYGSWEEGEKKYICLCISATLRVCGSVCVDVRSSQMMIQLTGVSRAYLTVPRVGES